MLKRNTSISIGDLLLTKYDTSKKNPDKLTKKELALVKQLNHLTFEAIIIHTLCILFSNYDRDSDIYFMKSSTLIEYLSRTIYDQASCFQPDKAEDDQSATDEIREKYKLGKILYYMLHKEHNNIE